MPISTQYNKTVTTERLADVAGSFKEVWSAYLTGIACAIHSESPEHNLSLNGASYKLFKMWCAVGTDILTGDKVVDGSIKYHVRSVSKKDYGSGDTQHLVVMLSLGE